MIFQLMCNVYILEDSNKISNFYQDIANAETKILTTNL